MMRGRGRGREHLSSGDGRVGSTTDSSAIEGGMNRMGLEGRGRSRAANYDLVATKPASIVSKMGKAGTPIKLITNFFGFKQKPDYRILQYRVDIADVEPTYMRKKLVRQHKASLPEYIFDGTVFFCVNRLFSDRDSLTLTSELPSSAEDGNLKPKIVDVVFKLVGEIHATDHHYLQFYAVVLRQFMDGLDLKQIGRNFYDTKDIRDIPEYHLEVLPGYITSIRQHEHSILMCSEVTNKVLRKDTLLDQLLAAKRSGKYEQFAESLIGSVVMTKYNNKTYRIDDFSTETPKSTFERGGKSISFASYYREKYDIQVRDMDQRLIISQPKDRDRRGGRMEPVSLIPELCFMTGLTDEQRANFRVMSALAQYTRQNPTDRMKTLMAFNKRLTTNKVSVDSLKQWDMALETSPKSVNARVLPTATIVMGNNREFILDSSADFSRDFGRSAGMFTPVTINRLLIMHTTRDERDVKNFVAGLNKVSGKLGVTMTNPIFEMVNGSRTNDFMHALKNIVPMKKPYFVLIFLPTDNSETYSSVKKFLCIDYPTPSQVVTCSKVLKKYMKNGTPQLTFPTKILAQMGAKLGGEPWVCKGMPPSVMVVGFDTYHDTQNKGSSVGALVGSYNASLTKYCSACSFHTSREEITSQIVTMFGKLLKNYQSKNAGSLPKRIFFYRDGVGEGQVSYVVEHEVEALRRCFKMFNPDWVVKFVFIIVSKRINTRFFLPTSRPGCYDNPIPGTVVDDVVTLPERYDFFIVSQSVRQGTVNPTSYNVVFDESGCSPDQVQGLSQKLTHLYFNWCGTVRVPAPCQYAHKLAFLVGTSLHKEASDQLSDTLYYL